MLLAAFAYSDPHHRPQGTPNTRKMASPFLAINSMEPEELGGLKGEGMSSHQFSSAARMTPGTDYSRSSRTEKSTEVNRLMNILREDLKQKHLVSPRMCLVFNPYKVPFR